MGNIFFSLSTLGDKSAVDFERQLFQDALPILQDLLRPRRIMPGVILEQAYIDRIAEGVKPLQNLASSSAGKYELTHTLFYVIILVLI